jgi:hypothetical protein
MTRKTVFISIIGHMALFSAFSLSFGTRVPNPNYSAISFWGQLLSSSQVTRPILEHKGLYIRDFLTRKPETFSLSKISKDSSAPSGYLKPPVNLAFNTGKETFFYKSNAALHPLQSNAPAIIFHPLLPYSFTLYFNDRQIAHVELMFKVAKSTSSNSALIKRKISSGNLEADLLIMRYIGRYIFIQQARFSEDDWHTVKIDLSAKND